MLEDRHALLLYSDITEIRRWRNKICVQYENILKTIFSVNCLPFI